MDSHQTGQKLFRSHENMVLYNNDEKYEDILKEINSQRDLVTSRKRQFTFYVHNGLCHDYCNVGGKER